MKGVGFKIIEYAYRIIVILHFHIIDKEVHHRTAYSIQHLLQLFQILGPWSPHSMNEPLPTVN